MERITIITHNNYRIVMLDCKGLSENEVCEWIDKLTPFAIKNRIPLFLLDVTGTHTTPKVRDVASKSVKEVKSHLGDIHTALVGLSVVQRLIANAISPGQYFASSIEDAKKWLVSKSNKAS